MLILLASCFGHDHLLPEDEMSVLPETPYDQYMVPSGKNLIYGHVPGLTPSADTKTTGSGDFVSLESLLDRTATTEEYFGNWFIRQIEFKKTDYNQMLLLKDSLGIEMNSMGIIKKFLVEAVDTSTHERFSKIATIIPTDEYCMRHNPRTISYLNKPAFRGVIVYSNFDCSLSNIYIYGPHPIQVGKIIEANEADNYRYIRYLSLIDFGNVTKSENETIEGAICIGVTKPWFPDTGEDDDNYDYVPDSGDEDDDNSIGAGGGTPNPDDEEVKNDSIEEAKIVDDKITFKVELYSNIAMGNSWRSRMLGAGVYSKNDKAYIAAPTILESDFYNASGDKSSYTFHWWTGDLPEISNPIQTIVMDKDISATAYYFEVNIPEIINHPCFDKERGIYNPLVNMEVAPTKYNGVAGGTYGTARGRFHKGLDLYAEVGTPVFAMIDGIIAWPYVTSQPDRINKYYPDSYVGDKNDAGNRIYIVGNYDDNSVKIGYWHLQEGTPVAKNPRTGQPYKPGDKVYAGDLIGYTGRTGNANKTFKNHLHLFCSIDNKIENPELIINGKLDRQNNVLQSPQIIDVECDN